MLCRCPFFDAILTRFFPSLLCVCVMPSHGAAFVPLDRKRGNVTVVGNNSGQETETDSGTSSTLSGMTVTVVNKKKAGRKKKGEGGDKCLRDNIALYMELYNIVKTVRLGSGSKDDLGWDEYLKNVANNVSDRESNFTVGGVRYEDIQLPFDMV